MQIKNCTGKLKILQTGNMNGPKAVRPFWATVHSNPLSIQPQA